MGSTQRAGDVHDDLQGILCCGTCRVDDPLFDCRGVALVLPWSGGTSFHGEEHHQQRFGNTFVPRVLLDGHDGDRQEYGQRGIRGLHASLQVSLLLLAVVLASDLALLLRYISGDNERNEKIEMTVPVLASVVPGQGPFCEENFTYHFYLPKKFQSNPPKPSDPRVTNV